MLYCIHLLLKGYPQPSLYWRFICCWVSGSWLTFLVFKKTYVCFIEGEKKWNVFQEIIAWFVCFWLRNCGILVIFDDILINCLWVVVVERNHGERAFLASLLWGCCENPPALADSLVLLWLQTLCPETSNRKKSPSHHRTAYWPSHVFWDHLYPGLGDLTFSHLGWGWDARLCQLYIIT